MQTLLPKAKNLLFSSLSRKLLFFLYFLLVLAILYHIYYAKRIVPGVMVGDVSLGGKTKTEAETVLSNYEKNLEKQLLLKFDGKEYKFKAEAVELSYDWEGTVLRSFEVGRTGNFFCDNKDKLAGLLKNLKILAFHDHNDEKLISVISEAKSLFNIIAQNASISLENGKIVVVPENEGIKVLDDSIHTTIIQSFDTMSFGEKNLPGKKVVPKISASEVESLLPQVEKIVFNNISVSDGSNTWKLGSEEIMGLLSFQRDKEKDIVEIVLDEPRFEAFVDEIAEEVGQLPRGQVTSTDGNKVTGFKIIQEGSELDKKNFVTAFKDAFFNEGKTVEIPKIATSGFPDKEKYGILELLGEGSSTYKGSITGRINNLILAAERTSGVLVAPGETYSMNASIGDISSKTGYDVAYIIKEGRTVLGSGGGVCQTSTTLFRAALNAGLPIVSRHAHAYRVSYYEQDMPVGFDAAIFQPSWDFKFKNDTENYVLVQTEADRPNYSLKFKIFGTPDGREVDISEPVVTKQTPPPPALYQDDPTLAKGVVKQVDWSAWGASVKFTRIVTRDGEELFTETFDSRYQPWRAIYLVGTKE